jgi:hypothetical protein
LGLFHFVGGLSTVRKDKLDNLPSKAWAARPPKSFTATKTARELADDYAWYATETMRPYRWGGI